MATNAVMLDKFYTNDEVSREFIASVETYLNLDYFDNIIEPSAGDGKLLQHLPESTLAYDLVPEREGITQMDFFDYEFPEGKNLVVMNPPFGKRSKLAVDFFNKAAEHCEAIACIIPCTWEKYTLHRHLDPDWHLVYNERLPEDAFLLEGKPYKVRCVKQLWVHKDKNKDGWEGFND